MKKVDSFILRAFVGPFIATFFIALLVLILQFLWKYIDDLVGKGLELGIVAELMFYMSATMVPLAMPIAVLLAAIMTLGNIGENYELVAIKSSGISLIRFIMPLIIVAVLVSGLSFLFANNIGPVANLKAMTMLYSVTRQRPALNIKPGVFNDGIQNYVIYVGELAKGGREMRNIIIYDHSERQGNVNSLYAERGEMHRNEADSSLVFLLYNGYQVEEPASGGNPSGPGRNPTNAFIRNNFTEYRMLFDLSNFSFNQADENMFKNSIKLMNVNQLTAHNDSIRKKMTDRVSYLEANLKTNFIFFKDSTFFKTYQAQLNHPEINPLLQNQTNFAQILTEFPPNMAVEIKQAATRNARNVKNFARLEKTQQGNYENQIIKAGVILHQKITLSLACFVLFLIGAPLGAIIRRGGLGMPMIVAIAFFLSFHILSTIGKKMAESKLISPFLGGWMPLFILFPVGLFFIYKAMNDSALFNIENYLPRLKWGAKFFTKKNSPTKK
ncbi:MAG: LptF/LptG family permease [Sphingobacteriales bacterium]|nr:LptF/LptG family permease [Sphingobacteriales bacterium]